MKIMTILGTRPEFIRLSLIIKELDSILGENHIIVNTNQNFSDNLSLIFLKSMYEENFKCDYNLNIQGTFAEQISSLFPQLEKIIKEEKPDRFFVLGDTNSSVGGIIAKRMGLKVFHLEAGNRSFDEKTPEEVNRKLIDHCSDILMTYSQNSKRLLLNEGFRENRVFCVGNPIFEVMNYFDSQINNKFFKIDGVNINEPYHLCTLHRSENVDDKKRLKLFINVLERISLDKKVILIVHPHLNKKLIEFDIKINGNINQILSVGFFEFICLEKMADIVLTDSGTVQEECQILNKKCIILRDSTERWETIENGSCIITGCNEEKIITAFELLKENYVNYDRIEEYKSLNVSDRVVRILLNNYLW